MASGCLKHWQAVATNFGFFFTFIYNMIWKFHQVSQNISTLFALNFFFCLLLQDMQIFEMFKLNMAVKSPFAI